MKLTDTQLLVVEDYAQVRVGAFCNKWAQYLESQFGENRLKGIVVFLSTLAQEKDSSEDLVNDFFPQKSHPKTNRNLINLGRLVRGEEIEARDPDKLFEYLFEGRLGPKVGTPEERAQIRMLVGKELKDCIFNDIKENLRILVHSCTFPEKLTIAWDNVTPEEVFDVLYDYALDRESAQTQGFSTLSAAPARQTTWQETVRNTRSVSEKMRDRSYSF